MHIKQITLDGFKSYGKRTDVKGFDPEFNAITGLNGTGKSNVLDSICFVLGISNLSQVRILWKYRLPDFPPNSHYFLPGTRHIPAGPGVQEWTGWCPSGVGHTHLRQ